MCGIGYRAAKDTMPLRPRPSTPPKAGVFIHRYLSSRATPVWSPFSESFSDHLHGGRQAVHRHAGPEPRPPGQQRVTPRLRTAPCAVRNRRSCGCGSCPENFGRPLFGITSGFACWPATSLGLLQSRLSYLFASPENSRAGVLCLYLLQRPQTVCYLEGRCIQT
jgi:hypothetical protein